MNAEQLAAVAKHSFYVFPKLASGNKIPRHLKFIGKKVQEAIETKSEKNRMLLISIPCRHGKSQMISCHLPAWYLGTYPKNRIILTSYSSELSDKHSDQARNMFAKWGYYLWDINPSKSTFNRSSWDTELGGGCISAGVGGSITGFGADCISPESLIKTISYDVEISKLKVGDKVLSYNSNKLCYNKVLAIKTSRTKEIYEITIDEDIIKSTGNHRFFIKGKGYVKAKDLLEGDKTVSVKQKIEERKISKIKRFPVDNELMYDIQVEKTSNFFANNILVHNCLIIDDYVKGHEEAESKTQREKLWNWWQSVASSRLHPNSVVIIIATRWNDDDLMGKLIKQHKEEGEEFPFEFEHINLPAIAEEDDPLGRTPGKALWPERFNEKMLLNVRKIAGPYVWSSLWQGDPKSRGGNLFKSAYFRYFTMDWRTSDYVCHPIDEEEFVILKKDLRIIVIVDPALEIKKRNDPTGMLAWGYSKKYKVWLLLDALKGKFKHELVTGVILNFAFKNRATEIYVEDEKIGKILVKQSAGKDVVNGVNIPFKEVKTKNKDKFSRCVPMASYMENGRVFFRKDAHWLEEYTSDITAFPDQDDDCFADCTGHAVVLEKSISIAEVLMSALKKK